MRENIFRGKDVDSGRIVTGDLQKSGNCYYIKENERWHKVIPETIGQRTGILDIIGTPIFEGDEVCIIRDSMTSKSPMTVIWDSGCAAFVLVDNPQDPYCSEGFYDDDKYVIMPPKGSALPPRSQKEVSK